MSPSWTKQYIFIMRILSLVFISLLMFNCEKPELMDDMPQAIGYEVKGWSSSKTAKTSKTDVDPKAHDKSTKFIVENSIFAEAMGTTPNGHDLYEILLTNGEPVGDTYEVIGSVVYHIDAEGYLIVSSNDMTGSFHGRYSDYEIR